MIDDRPPAPDDPAIVVPIRDIESNGSSAPGAHLIRGITATMMARINQRLATGERVLLIVVTATDVITDIRPVLGVSDTTAEGYRSLHLSRVAAADRALIGQRSPVPHRATIEYWDPQHGVGAEIW